MNAYRISLFVNALWVSLMMFSMALLLMLVNECLQGFISVYAPKVSLLIPLKAVFNESLQGFISC